MTVLTDMADIKLLVQEEGRSARNLVTFSVPVINQTQPDTSKVLRKPPTSPRTQSDIVKKDEVLRISKRSRESSQSGSRVRSASTGRDKKSELHARYWAFLFGNLQRAVDEIYQTCESDESVTECKETIMVLDNYTREFKNLINWFKIKWEYETTPPPQRPRSLAWEIRKSSPGKIRHKSLDYVDNISNPEVGFFLNNNLEVITKNNWIENKNNPPVSNICTNKVSVQDEITNNLKKQVDCNGKIPLETQLINVINDVKDIEQSLNNSEKVETTNLIIESKPVDNICVSSKKVLSENKSINVTGMIDKICQTDIEIDDENKEKCKLSQQETCSVIHVEKIDSVNEEEVKSNETDSKTYVSKATGNEIVVPKVKGKVDLENLNKVDTKISPKISPLLSSSKGIQNPVQSRSVTYTSKGLNKNSYSNATILNSKGLNSVRNPIKLESLAKSSSRSSSDKKAVQTPQRQPWESRSVSNVLGKVSSSNLNSSVRTKLQKSPASVNVQNSKLACPKSFRKSSELAQVENEKKKNSSSLIVNKQPNLTNSDDFSKSFHTLTSTDTSLKNGETCASVGVLHFQNYGSEEESGWVKVRSKSRFTASMKTHNFETMLSRSATNLKSKSDQKGITRAYHKTRFNQPSSAVSLPTLAFSNSEFNTANKKTVKTKTDARNKPKESLKVLKNNEKNKLMEVNNKNINSEIIKKSPVQLLNERNLNETISEAKKHELLEAGKEVKPFLKEKEAIYHINTLINDQETIDDEENSFDEEIKKNKETEEMLQKEINELEATDIEVDIETGDEETDGEATTGNEEEPDQEKKCVDIVSQPFEKKSSPKKQHRYEQMLSGMSWADHMDTLDELEKLVVLDCSNKGMTKDEQMDTLERLEEFVARHPGRALELHQKLSSPSRRRTMLDTVKRFQARQAKASEKREQLKMAKAQKLRELLKKVDEVKAAKDKLIEDRRQRLEMKLKRAAENRKIHLKEIMRKAHDEEEKLKEIAFINELEAQNKRHDFMTQCQEQEDRLQGIHEERQRKQEEKAAKEAAVEERRKAIEAERQEKLEKLQERQRKRDEQADKKKQEKEKERQELAREKARDRSERLEALHAAQLEAQEELQKKIQQKQEEYARRHEENIEQIRQKALELSILKCFDDVAPKLVPYETQKLCTICNVLISSEVYLLSHLRGKKHQEAVKSQMNGKDFIKEEIERFNLAVIVNAPSDKVEPKIAVDRERIKSFKKKYKKLRLRMISKGEEYLSEIVKVEKFDSPGKGKLQKCLKDIEKAISTQGKGQWSDSSVTVLERSMGEISRTLNKLDSKDQIAFKLLNGFTTLNSILELNMEVPPNMTSYLPQKCFVTTCSAYFAAVNSAENCKFVILSNKIILLLDLLLKHLSSLIPEHKAVNSMFHSKSCLPVDPVASILMRVIAKILIAEKDDCSEQYLTRLQDIISYAVSSGIVDKLAKYCSSVRDPIDDDYSAAQFLISILELLSTLTARCKTVRQGNEDPTQLLATLQVTELVGAVSILYGMLLHQGTPPRLIDSSPPILPSHTISVAIGTIRLLRFVAELDLQMFQSVLGAEGISLQFRHIASYLLWYCCNGRENDLLHEVVAVVGYFAVQHRDNQMILQSGSTPTVLQQLCNLPFPYFSKPELSALLFPTLLACCSGNEENKAILEQEISYSLLEDFMESDVAKNHPLLQIISSRLKDTKS